MAMKLLNHAHTYHLTTVAASGPRRDGDESVRWRSTLRGLVMTPTWPSHRMRLRNPLDIRRNMWTREHSTDMMM